jgi:hypothetical protein
MTCGERLCSTRDMTCPRCMGHGYKAIAPGYVECTNVIVTNGPVNTANGTAIVPLSSVCGYRYHTGGGGGTQMCACGTFAIGLCHDCGVPVCGGLLVSGHRPANLSALRPGSDRPGRGHRIRDHGRRSRRSHRDRRSNRAVPADHLPLQHLRDARRRMGQNAARIPAMAPRVAGRGPMVRRHSDRAGTGSGRASRDLHEAPGPSRQGSKFVPSDPIPCWSLWNRREDPNTAARPARRASDHLQGSLYLRVQDRLHEDRNRRRAANPGQPGQAALLKMIELLDLTDDRPGLKHLKY